MAVARHENVALRWRRNATRLGILAVIAGIATPHPSPADDTRPAGLAPTISGFTAMPTADQSVRVGDAGVAIRFRAPATADVAKIHTWWRRPHSGCRVALHEDADGQPGAGLGAVALPDAPAGWVTVPLVAPIVAGRVYDAVLQCDGSEPARLGYTLDDDNSARDSGAWQLVELRGGRVRVRRRPATPVFALTLADGRSWGQPYHAVRGRAVVRVCDQNEVSATLVPTRELQVTDLELRRGNGIAYTISTADGRTLLSGSNGVSLFALPAATMPSTLSAGVAYTLHLRATAKGDGCLRQRAIATDLELGPALGGLDLTRLSMTSDGGRSWHDAGQATLALQLLGSEAPLATCGDGTLDADEECDGSADAACPGRCTNTCTCRAPDTNGPAPACGDGTLDAGEECDGAADDACPGHCTAACTCDVVAPPPTHRYRSIYTSGYLGAYDPATIPVWPKKLGVILGGPDIQGPLIADAKQVAIAAGNTDARFVFYLNLTSLDSKCNCFESRFYQSVASAHPEWILRDSSGNLISAFVTQYGAGRLWTTDLGNPAFVDAWGDVVLAEMDRHGWDGVWADNILRGNFYDWSAWPVNPRTGRPYTTEGYRQDTLAALLRLRARFDAKGKILIGNYGSAWEPDTMADPVVQQQIVAMHGVEIEDCVYTFSGTPHSETTWINQLTYLDFANRHGVLTQCRGGNGTISDPTKRDYILASYLLTKEGFSNVAQLNNLSAWWPGLETDLGDPVGGFTCLDPAASLAPTANCPSIGKIYAREWEHGRVLANPTGGITTTVALGETMLLNGQPVTSVTLKPKSGVVLVRP
jgi:hypothetical protein